MTRYTHKPAIRALQDQLNAEHADVYCYYDSLCPHGTPPPPMPAGVIALVGSDHRRRPATHIVVLVRFKRRQWGGWSIVRADNGRLLGWTDKVTSGEHGGRWSAHVTSNAFRGDGPDNEGELLDTVQYRLYNGDPNNSLVSNPIDYGDRRMDAAEAIVQHLVEMHAPAVGYPRHYGVTVHRTRPTQHFELDGRCVCGGPVDCPERARLLAAVTR
ncbi:hypothetical protein [Verrucosispora sp. TAA-831]|uniref:hypothetical protein n=1 Tax=Verrucosispora sp. TAA-831 TaxID=3422227 RepID=UPI003D6EB515